MTYVLYGENGSGSFCIEAALVEACAAYEFKNIDMSKDEQRAPEFLAINPSGKIPALQLPSGEIVTETSALLFVLAERHPESNLLPPAGTPEKAQAMRWIAFLASEVYPMVEIADYPDRFVADHRGAAVLKLSAKQRIRHRMATADAAAAGPWFLAGGFSAVDIYAAMFSRWRECREGGWREENIPKICAIAAGIAERPGLVEVWKRYFPNG